MRLDPLVRALLEPCLGADLGRVRVHGGRTGRLITRLAELVSGRRVSGITFGRHVFLAPAAWRAYRARTPGGLALIGHEARHVLQYAELGVPRFLLRYLGEYVANRRAGMSAGAAYRAIGFEREGFATGRALELRLAGRLPGPDRSGADATRGEGRA